jgi:hypothetical protein
MEPTLDSAISASDGWSLHRHPRRPVHDRTFATDLYLRPCRRSPRISARRRRPSRHYTFLAGLALGQLLAGPLSDAYGRGCLIAGLSVFAACLACALTPSVEVLIGVRFVQASPAPPGW